jgi:5'-nucleotidase
MQKRECTAADVMLLAASSTRCYSLDMTLTLQDLREAYPYDGKIFRVKVTGAMLRSMIKHMLRDEVLDDWEDVFFHTSRDLGIVYDKDTGDLEIRFRGKPLEDDQILSIGMQEFYYLNSETGLGMTNEELEATDGIRTLSIDAFGTLRDYFAEHSGMGGRIDKRFILKGTLRGRALEMANRKKK